VDKLPLKDHGVPVSGPFGFDHVSFGMETDDALWDLKEKLEAAGFWVSELIDHGFIHSIYTFDPNYIPIEFSVVVTGIDLRKNPKMMDKHSSLASGEGPEPQPGHWPEPVKKTPESEKFIFPGEGLELLKLAYDNLK
jgi:hypothetical protein